MSPQMENHALHSQIDASIRDIGEGAKVKGACSAHWPLVNGVKVLLECAKADLESREAIRSARLERENKQDAASTVTWGKLRITGSAAVVAAVVVAVGALLGAMTYVQHRQTRQSNEEVKTAILVTGALPYSNHLPSGGGSGREPATASAKSAAHGGE